MFWLFVLLFSVSSPSFFYFQGPLANNQNKNEKRFKLKVIVSMCVCIIKYYIKQYAAK